MEKLIVLKNIYFSYKSAVQNNTEIKFSLKNVSLNINEHELIGISGFSGSGKSTLAKIILGKIGQKEGLIDRFYDDIDKDCSSVQMLFQNNEYLLNPFRKVKNNLSDIEKDKNRVYDLFSKFNLSSELLDQKAMFLSGGERQRIALIKILLSNPKLIILDEPFSAQDPESNKNIEGIIKSLHKEGLTIIIISHLIEELIDLVDRIIVLDNGEITLDDLTENSEKLEKNKIVQLLLKASKFKLSEKMPSDKL